VGLPNRNFYRSPRGAGWRPLCGRLVAVTGADGNLVTALGAAAIENGSASLGLHAGQKTVGLGTAAAVGLKGTLRHGTELLKGQERPAGSF
jgi:hypothetical protein